MTKRSSFVIPPVRISVAANVDMLIRSPKSLMQARPDAPIFCRTDAWSFNRKVTSP
jgi:hypothetical protein